MGAPVHSYGFAILPDGEGVLAALVETRHPPKVEAVLMQEIRGSIIKHDSCSTLEFVCVSETKSVLCCKGCLLRISLPSKVKTLDDLRSFFATST